MEMDRRQTDLKLAHNFEKDNNVEKVQLPINNDTSFDIYYDICEIENTKYLYIKMIENTANAPFYYNKSYTIEDLYELHKIFKSDDIDEVKEDFKSLFENGKITLEFDKGGSIVNMKLDVINFATNYKINFALYREMIPCEEKDQKLLDLYVLNKKNLKTLKEFYSFLEKYKGKNDEMPIAEDLVKKIKSFDIPGIETVNENDDIDNSDINNPDIKPERKQTIAKKSKICPSLQNKYIFKIDKGNFTIFLNLQNIYDFNWPVGKTHLKCDEENSNLKPLSFDEPPYEIEKQQDGDFKVYFNKDDIKPGKYICNLNLYVNGVKLEDSDIELNIRAK